MKQPEKTHSSSSSGNYNQPATTTDDRKEFWPLLAYKVHEWQSFYSAPPSNRYNNRDDEAKAMKTKS